MLEKMCCKCGNHSVPSESPFGDPYFHKYYDENGKWIENSWLCNDCYIDEIKNRICCICGNNPHWHKDRNGKGDWTGKHVCDQCYDEYNINSSQIIVRKIICDTYVCLGYDKKWRYIDAVYIIPNEGFICNIIEMKIIKNPSRSSKYHQFKIDNNIYNEN